MARTKKKVDAGSAEKQEKLRIIKVTPRFSIGQYISTLGLVRNWVCYQNSGSLSLDYFAGQLETGKMEHFHHEEHKLDKTLGELDVRSTGLFWIHRFLEQEKATIEGGFPAWCICLKDQKVSLQHLLECVVILPWLAMQETYKVEPKENLPYKDFLMKSADPVFDSTIFRNIKKQ